MKSTLDRFHDHLESCAHCAANPENLCEQGKRLMLEADLELRADPELKVYGLTAEEEFYAGVVQDEDGNP